MNDTKTIPEDDTPSSRRTDPELLVMGRMIRELDDLDEPAQSRVVGWLNSRYTKTVRTTSKEPPPF